MSEVYGNREIIINIADLILIFLSVIMATTILVVAVRTKQQTRRMGWFIGALCMVMGGLKAQLAAEKMFGNAVLQASDSYLARSLVFYSLVAPLFSLYFIETEREEGQKWDGFFWTALQSLIALLVIILVLFSKETYFVYFYFLVQYVIVVVMLLISSKDIKSSLGFVIGAVFPVAAALVGMTTGRADALGFSMVMLLLIVFFGYQMDTEQELLNKQMELSENKMKVMMDQIHPHFIYNSLQQIALLSDEDPKAVKPAILSFSAYLRKNLESLTNTGMIPFMEEVEHADIFIRLAEILPSRAFTVEKDFQVTDFSIPALTLQPLVENAIKYGIGMSTKGSKIRIRTREEGGYILVSVVDDGHGEQTMLPTQKKHKSVGTANVKARLDTLCGGTLEVHKLEKGTEAVIRLPAFKVREELQSGEKRRKGDIQKSEQNVEKT